MHNPIIRHPYTDHIKVNMWILHVTILTFLRWQKLPRMLRIQKDILSLTTLQQSESKSEYPMTSMLSQWSIHCLPD